MNIYIFFFFQLKSIIAEIIYSIFNDFLWMMKNKLCNKKEKRESNKFKRSVIYYSKTNLTNE